VLLSAIYFLSIRVQVHIKLYNNYLSAPNYPYRDFNIRFGLVWNFFL